MAKKKDSLRAIVKDAAEVTTACCQSFEMSGRRSRYKCLHRRARAFLRDEKRKVKP